MLFIFTTHLKHSLLSLNCVNACHLLLMLFMLSCIKTSRTIFYLNCVKWWPSSRDLSGEERTNSNIGSAYFLQTLPQPLYPRIDRIWSFLNQCSLLRTIPFPFSNSGQQASCVSLGCGCFSDQQLSDGGEKKGRKNENAEIIDSEPKELLQPHRYVDPANGGLTLRLTFLLCKTLVRIGAIC